MLPGMPRCEHGLPDERIGTLGERLKQVADHHLNYRRKASLRMLIAFLLTFGLIRLLTYAIHQNFGPFHDITLGGGANGVHIHHYMWGLLLIAVCGFLALSLEAVRWHPVLAIPFGIGLALVIDEFALLLQLRDVYWMGPGLVSVAIAILAGSLLLIYYLGQCYWHDVITELGRGWRVVRAEEEKLAGRL
jgi:hypothetical protein